MIAQSRGLSSNIEVLVSISMKCRRITHPLGIVATNRPDSCRYLSSCLLCIMLCTIAVTHQRAGESSVACLVLFMFEMLDQWTRLYDYADALP